MVVVRSALSATLLLAAGVAAAAPLGPAAAASAVPVHSAPPPGAAHATGIDRLPADAAGSDFNGD